MPNREVPIAILISRAPTLFLRGAFAAHGKSVDVRRTICTLFMPVENWLKQCLPKDSFLFRQLKAVKQLAIGHPDKHVFLERFARKSGDVFFVQIGSADGLIGDPLHGFIKKYGWHGVLVEPVGFLFSQLQENYRGQPGLIFDNVAISDEDGVREFHYLRPLENPPHVWYHQLGTFFPDNIRKLSYALPNVEADMVSEKISCLRLETLLRKHKVKKIDLLHVDAEGYDFEVLKQLDLSKYSPAIILYEHKHLTSEDRAACQHYLETAGYRRLACDYNDTLMGRK